MLSLFVTTLLASSALAADTVDCRAQATVEDATGIEFVNPVLFRSCLARQDAETTRLNRWVGANSCPADLEAFRRAANQQAHTCRLGAVELDASGHPRVNRGIVRRCMAEEGFERASAERVATWVQTCSDTAVALIALDE